MDTSDVKSAIKPVSEKWKLLGINLGISLEILEEIDCEHLKIRHKRREMIQVWMTGTTMATWSSLVEALHSPSIALHETAERISKQHSKCVIAKNNSLATK